MSRMGLVADVGGTNVRFALVDIDGGHPAFESMRKYSTKSHPDIAAAARTYLSEVNYGGALAGLVFGVAGPVKNGSIHLTNAGWTISERELRDALKVQLARVVNDFEALGEAIPVFEPQDLHQIGPLPFDPKAEGTVAVVGPGTGLGVGGLIRREGAMLPLVTEGGHASFAPQDELEVEVLKILWRKAGRVSNERILSGPGLLNLYGAMAEIEGRPATDSTPEIVTQIAREKPDSFEAKVFARFCAILGSVAGDVALGMGARNGVLIGGGILPGAAEFLAASDFRKRFEDKARFKGYMQDIPTCLIMDSHAGLLGAWAILRLQLSAH